jgi:thiol-disulfide isomerase/thioredoxin
MEDRRAIARAAGIGALVFITVMAFGAPRWMGGFGMPSPLVGRAAPDLTLAIVAGDGAGDRVTLSALRGHVVMLDFWASWCPPCRESIPLVGRVAARHASAGLVSFAVNVETDRTAAGVAEAHRALGVMVPTLFDVAGQAQTAFEVSALPTLVLVDRDGVVRAVETGVPDEAALDRTIEGLL